MRVRLWIPLPGPFAVTSGRRTRQRKTYAQEYGPTRRGLVWWPGSPPDSGFVVGSFWMAAVVVALAWNLLALALIIPVVALVRKVKGCRPTEETPATVASSQRGLY